MKQDEIFRLILAFLLGYVVCNMMRKDKLIEGGHCNKNK